MDAGTGNITVAVGGGGCCFSGDGGPASAAGIAAPWGIAFDPDGNLFFSSVLNHIVRRVDAGSGIITTVAGTQGVSGFGGDGAMATAAGAMLDNPRGIAFDASGNLFIADSVNLRVRRVDAVSGVITTFAGTGINATSPDGGLATTTDFFTVDAVLVDPDGNVFISSGFGETRVRRVDAVTNIVSTVAGIGVNGFSGDGGPTTSARIHGMRELKLDSAGNLFLASSENHVIRRIDTIAAAAIQEVAIDITPGIDPNRITVNSEGNVRVAILSDVGFDASSVDPSTVTFGPNAAGIGHAAGHINDVNRDGLPDLFFHFMISDTGIACGDISASLTGTTFGGQAIEGTDPVMAVPCR